ncbi:MAG: carbohydrate kinase, thermoresistant glucokinase family [Gemmatimonadetes bacterium]|nr:carbohydrate kinase, thermoresistant glucokinase family [Gemmatimonadota bacterium]
MSNDGASGVRVIVVMGVTGAGKTTVGHALADALGWSFYDADELHSPENKAKMHRGEGLTDADRAPWLATLGALVARVIANGEHAVLACSALKQSYRDVLVPKDAPPDAVRFVFLDVPSKVLRERLAMRGNHFATANLLPSQFATLEVPSDALRVDGTRPVPEIVQTVRQAFGI